MDIESIKNKIQNNIQDIEIFRDLEMKLLTSQGRDNIMYLLGSDYIVRIPKTPKREIIENKYLNDLSLALKKIGFIDVQIPEVIIDDSEFSILKYIKCDNDFTNLIEEDKMQIANSLINFLKALHRVDITGPEPSRENGWRGGDLSVYSEDLYRSLDVMKCSNILESNILSILKSDILNIWNESLTFKNIEKFWVHGDLTKDNILLNNKKLFAIIDFGCMAIGDRAVDLSIAYTFFE